MTTAPIYRPGVGIMLIDRQGRVFIGRRRNKRLAEHVAPGYEWQMPQGGIDEDEEPYQAALRELREETNVGSVSLLAEAPDWYTYDLPDPIARQSWKGRYIGQRQKWFALRFEGEDAEIDIAHPAGGHRAGIRCLALGKDGAAAGSDHSVQTARLRTGRGRIRAVRGSLEGNAGFASPGGGESALPCKENHPHPHDFRAGQLGRAKSRRPSPKGAGVAHVASLGGYAMRHFDLSPLYRSTVGFDRLFSMLDQTTGVDAAASQTYPPYNIERTGENAYRITVAVAGFAENELAIETKEGSLLIRGSKETKAQGRR